MNRNSWKRGSCKKSIDQSFSNASLLPYKEHEQILLKQSTNHLLKKTKPRKHCSKTSLVNMNEQTSLFSTPYSTPLSTPISTPKLLNPKENILHLTSPFKHDIQFKPLTHVTPQQRSLKRESCNRKIKESRRSIPKQTPTKNQFKENKNASKQTTASTKEGQLKSLCRTDFKFLHQIGSGGFGSVWKVKEQRTGAIYAMKQISKAKVLHKKSVHSVINEKMLLDTLSSPFIINTLDGFQDRDFLYLPMEYLRGGDLRYHICYKDEFSQQQVRFMVACILLSLEYIHAQHVIHRDLKPQNLVFEENGYLRLTDFGVARKKSNSNGEETSGTPGYMAPQVICRINHSYEADYFALGVIVYEIIRGKRPYMGDSRKEIRDKILAHQAKLHENELPYSWGREAADFVNKLLKRNKELRLGYNGIQEVKNHPWLAGINWRRISRKEVVPPFVPGAISQSIEYQQEMELTQASEVDQQTLVLLRTPQVQQLFKTYQEQKKHKNYYKKASSRKK